MIRCKRIQDMKWTFDSISRDIKRYAENTDSIRRHLRGKISSYDQIGDQIGKITKNTIERSMAIIGMQSIKWTSKYMARTR